MTSFMFDTPDGEGEAVKDGQDTPWQINTPTGGFRFYGSVSEARWEVRKYLKKEYGPAEARNYDPTKKK